MGREYIYSGSALLATIAGSTTTYHHVDHLSVRVTTDSSGNVLAQQGHYPFGESWYQGSAGTKWQFTSYERDAESGNDYAMVRYHVNRLGRFSSPDPLAGSLADPQSLNRYAYTRNDPVALVDPLGLHWECVQVTIGGRPGPQTCRRVNDPVTVEVFPRVLYRTLAEYDDMRSGGDPGGGGVDVLKKTAEDLAKKKLDKKKCQEDLNKLGVTADQVRQGAAEANFLNGVGSSVPLASLYATSPVPSVRRECPEFRWR